MRYMLPVRGVDVRCFLIIIREDINHVRKDDYTYMVENVT